MTGGWVDTPITGGYVAMSRMYSGILILATVSLSVFAYSAASRMTEATLVALFFMHLLYDNKLNLVILVASFLFVAIFFTPTLIDLGTRGMLDPIKTRDGYKQMNLKPSTLPEPPVVEAVPAPAAPAAATPAPAAATPAPAAAPAAAAPAPAAPTAAAPVAKPAIVPAKPVAPAAAPVH